MTARIWIAWGMCAALLGCGSSDDSAPNGAPSSNPSAGTGGSKDAGVAGSETSGGGADERVGGFDLQLVAPVAAKGNTAATPGITRIVGRVYSSSVPDATVLELDREVGRCKLRVPRRPFCEAGCGGGVCVEDDQCQANPPTRSLGQVTVEGLRSDSSGPLVLTNVQNAYQIPGSVKVAYPPFDEGGALRITAAGAEVPAFTLEGRGIAALELPEGARYMLDATKPLEVRWTAPGDPSVSTIHLKLDISHHGGSKGQIDCDVDDNGQYTIDSSLIARLLGLGVAGFPTIVVTRNAASEVATTAGHIDLKVYMYQERAVEVAGLTSCTADTDCSSSQKCKPDQSCGPK